MSCDIQGFILKQSHRTCLPHASGMFDSVRECGIRPYRSNVPINICQTQHLFYRKPNLDTRFVT